LDGVTKLRLSQVVLPSLCSGGVISGDRRVRFLSPQIISGVYVLVGVGSVGYLCFVSAKGCELLVIPSKGWWIPAVGVLPGGGGRSWRVLGEEDANDLSVTYMRLDGVSGSLSLAALHVMVFFVDNGWSARRRVVGVACGVLSGRWKKLEEEIFTFKSFWYLFVIFFSSQGMVVIRGCTATF
jgi:hypothetical protein